MPPVLDLLPPRALLLACRRCQVRPTRDLLVISVARQHLRWYQRDTVGSPADASTYRLLSTSVASTSKFGLGQVRDTHRTPMGLHRVGAKIGGGWPVGTAFTARQPAGFVWDGCPNASIAHRILWLEGLEPGFNQGGDVDTRSRYIYLHGLADEPSLGRPASHGCVHLAARDLVPLFDRIPCGTLVWITPAP